MATLIWVEGWEHGAVSVAGTGIVNTITGTGMSISSSTKRTGGYSLRAYAASNAANFVVKSIGGSPTVLVARFYIYFTTLPAADTSLFKFVSATYVPTIKYESTGTRLAADYGGTGQQDGSAVVVDTWYRIDATANISANPRTLDWKVDGVAQTQATLAVAAETFTGVVVGCGSSTTYDIFFDDIAVSATSGDYPLGAGSVVGLSPTGEGTHSAGTVIKDTAGSVINGTTVQAYPLLDEVPMTSTSDYVQQDGTGTYYAEVTFADTAETSIVGAQAYLAYHASAATPPNDGEARIVDEDATETVIFNGDMSETTLSYKSVMLPVPAGGWDTAAVNALKARVGYSSDIAPVPYWDGLMIQVAYAESTAVDLVPAGGSQGQAGDGSALTQVHGLAPADGAQPQAGDSPLLAQTHVLAPVGGTQGQAGDLATLELTIPLVPQEGAQDQYGGPAAITQAHALAPGEGAQGQLGDGAALVQQHTLAPQEGTQAQLGDGAVFVQQHALAPQEGAQAQAGDSATITVESGAVNLVPQEGDQVQYGDGAALAQQHSLLAQDGSQAQAGDGAVLSQQHAVAPAGGSQVQSGDAAALEQQHALAPQEGTQTQAGDPAAIELVTGIDLVPDEGTQGQLGDGASLIVGLLTTYEFVDRLLLSDRIVKCRVGTTIEKKMLQTKVVEAQLRRGQ